MTRQLSPAPFGLAGPDTRGAEWKRLAVFLAFGAVFFLVAVVGAAFVPRAWPDAIRRAGHPMIFVPLAVALTVRMLRADARALIPAPAFDPWPVGRASVPWLLLGAALAGLVAVAFMLGFGLRWASNPTRSGLGCVWIVWAIVVTAAAEELAFRGYGLWRLMRLVGFWPAQAIVAALFVVSHLTLGGYSVLPALVGNVTGSVLYGAAFARSRSLAAAIALHSGWNIAQHFLLSPLDPTATPFVLTFSQPPTGRAYVGMLAILGVVMAATAAGILRFPATRRSSGPAR